MVSFPRYWNGTDGTLAVRVGNGGWSFDFNPATSYVPLSMIAPKGQGAAKDVVRKRSININARARRWQQRLRSPVEKPTEATRISSLVGSGNAPTVGMDYVAGSMTATLAPVVQSVADTGGYVSTTTSTCATTTATTVSGWLRERASRWSHNLFTSSGRAGGSAGGGSSAARSLDAVAEQSEMRDGSFVSIALPGASLAECTGMSGVMEDSRVHADHHSLPLVATHDHHS